MRWSLAWIAVALVGGCAIDFDRFRDAAAGLDAGPARDAGSLPDGGDAGRRTDGGRPDAGPAFDAGSWDGGAPPQMDNVTAIAAGGDTTCAIDDAGQLRCWGDNAFGQLGVAAPPLRADPAVVSLEGTAMRVAVGARHVCAEVNRGSQTNAVYCWGDSARGQAGLSMGERHEPTLILESNEVAALAAGGAHSCVALTTGAVRCWGDNASGQAGRAPGGQSPAAMDVGGTVNATRLLALGAAHSCIGRDVDIMTDPVKCFGDPSLGRLGIGSNIPTGGALDVDPMIDRPNAMAAGPRHTCAVNDASQQLHCWGDNAASQIAAGGGPLVSPTVVDGRWFAPIAAGGGVGSGTGFTCAVDTVGRLYCQGAASAGQLGRLGVACTLSPQPVDVEGMAPATFLGPIAQLAAGRRHLCLLSNGRVFCTGANDRGQLGRADYVADCRATFAYVEADR